MSVKASPLVLHAPLPGGKEGATVAVEPMSTGEVEMVRGWADHPGGRMAWRKALGIRVPESDRYWVPIPIFLVRHPAVGAILIDTGFHPSVASDPEQNLGRLTARLFKLRFEREQSAAEQLKARGVDPKDVRVVILTHLHFDHASGVSEFPQASVVVGDVEWWAAAGDRRPYLRGYRHAQFDFAFDYKAVDYNRRGVTSYSTFGRTFDLLGDGSIRLAYTPGHTAGHQSVVLRLADRDLVVAGDAVYNESHIAGRTEPWRTIDRHQWHRSRREIQRFREQHPESVIVPGHDPHAWKGLDERYE